MAKGEAGGVASSSSSSSSSDDESFQSVLDVDDAVDDDDDEANMGLDAAAAERERGIVFEGCCAGRSGGGKTSRIMVTSVQGYVSATTHTR